MAEVKSTTIIPITLYCFLLSIFSFSLAINMISSSKPGPGFDLYWWLPLGSYLIFMIGTAVVGAGILKGDILYWKILFFSMAICVSCVASFILAFLVALFFNVTFIFSYFQTSHITLPMWFCFLSFFLSEIIVLYYLTHNQVVSYFGGINNLLAPF